MKFKFNFKFKLKLNMENKLTFEMKIVNKISLALMGHQRRAI